MGYKTTQCGCCGAECRFSDAHQFYITIQSVITSHTCVAPRFVAAAYAENTPHSSPSSRRGLLCSDALYASTYDVVYPIVSKPSEITIAAKCAPVESALDAVVEAGLTAAELYTNNSWLNKIDEIVKTCGKYPLRYALHAPASGYEPDVIFNAAKYIKAEVMVFHNIYWEDEWKYITEKFSPLKCKLCMENVYSAIEPVKYMRRFGIGRCLDLEHLIMEVNGIFEEPFFDLIKESSHIHMTGYVFGSKLWHTPIHHAPEQGIYFLNLLEKAGYTGFVVSEAKESYQTRNEFKALYDFFKNWKDSRS